MSFTGDLQHLPIVDVIQLLNSTRKSGTLRVKGRKAENKIAFRDGFIVGANHSHDSVRIGKILVEMKAITPEVLDQALQDQSLAGAARKPLIAALIEGNQINRKDALAGLEKLIQLTVVEMVSWTRGVFALDIDTLDISAEYRYFPENLHQEICLDAQMVLMDALRIFDEKKRDGELEEEADDDESSEGASPDGEDEASISADDLGLSDLDQLERKIPEVFSGLEAFSPADIHRQVIQESLADFAAEQQEEFVDFLMQFSTRLGTCGGAEKPGGQARALILVCRDELIVHSAMTVCKHEGILVFATQEEQDLDRIIDQTLAKEIVPILVFDSPGKGEKDLSQEEIVRLRQLKKIQYPQVSTIQLASAFDYAFSLQAFKDGARAVLPKPLKEQQAATYIADLTNFLETFRTFIRGCFDKQGHGPLARLRDCTAELRELDNAPEISLALLRRVSEVFERSMTFVLRRKELIAERGIGIRGDKSEGPTPPLKLTIALSEPSIFRQVVDSGELFHGESRDEVLQKTLFATIGAPLRPDVLLLPMKNRGRVIALVYGDFGTREPSAVPIDFLEILAGQAGLVLENCLYRKQLEKASEARQQLPPN